MDLRNFLPYLVGHSLIDRVGKMLMPWSSLTYLEFLNLGPVVDGFRKLGWVVERVPSSSHGGPKTNGVYLLVHFLTGLVYVGSHSNIYARPYQHHSLLAKGAHWNKRLQQSFREHNGLLPMFIVTTTREEAFDLEQRMLDQFLSTGLLANTANNARLASKDLEVSIETRLKLSNSSKGRAQRPEWVEKRISALRGRKLAPETIEKLRKKAKERGVSPDLTRAAALVTSKRVSIEGVVYPSIQEAARSFDVTSSTIHKRIASKNPLFSNWNYFNPEQGQQP